MATGLVLVRVVPGLDLSDPAAHGHLGFSPFLFSPLLVQEQPNPKVAYIEFVRLEPSCLILFTFVSVRRRLDRRWKLQRDRLS